MKSQGNRQKGRLLKALLIFVIGVILILLGIWRSQNSGVSYSELYFQYYINNGAPILIVGIGFIVGAFLQLRNLSKNEDDNNKKKKKRKNKKLYR